MTREEALNKAINIVSYFEAHFAKSKEAREDLENIIEALEQESVLDKIRAEIEGYKSTIDNAISEDELKIEGMKEAYTDCLNIINKYKIESEVKE